MAKHMNDANKEFSKNFRCNRDITKMVCQARFIEEFPEMFLIIHLMEEPSLIQNGEDIKQMLLLMCVQIYDIYERFNTKGKKNWRQLIDLKTDYINSLPKNWDILNPRIKPLFNRRPHCIVIFYLLYK